MAALPTWSLPGVEGSGCGRGREQDLQILSVKAGNAFAPREGQHWFSRRVKGKESL